MLCWYEHLSSWHQEVLIRYLTQCVWSMYRLLDTLPLYLYYELLMISIYLTIILASSQGILMSWLVRNSWATHLYSTYEFYLVAELYCIYTNSKSYIKVCMSVLICTCYCCLYTFLFRVSTMGYLFQLDYNRINSR